jgi:cytochrome P450 family 6
MTYITIGALLKVGHKAKIYKHMSQIKQSIVSETLRKYPPIPALMRECSKPYKIPETDFVLDTGVRVIIPVIGLHHDPKYYPEPDRFDPERFSEEEKQNRHHYVYLPFGEGPRICIGKFHPSVSIC